MMSEYKAAQRLLVLIGLCLVFILMAKALGGETVISRKTGGSVVESLFLSVLSSLVLGLGWEYAAKKKFAQEVIDIVGASKEFEKAGIEKVGYDFSHDFSWRDLISGAAKIDIYFAYGQTWLSANKLEVQRAIERGIPLRIIFPDYENAEVIADYAFRFSSTPEDVKGRILASIGEIRKIMASADKQSASIEGSTTVESPLADDKAKGKAPKVDKRAKARKSINVEIKIISRVFAHTYYSFGDRGVVAMYRNAPDKGEVPAILVRSGSLRKFMESEFDQLWQLSSDLPNVAQ